jgi:hypothetical protein
LDVAPGHSQPGIIVPICQNSSGAATDVPRDTAWCEFPDRYPVTQDICLTATKENPGLLAAYR